MPLTEDRIKTYLVDKMGLDASDVDSQTSLFSSGLLDSFSLVDLIMFIESETNTKMSPLDVNLDNLDSIERMIRFAGSAG
jgi:acyl carrier protein